MNMLLERRRSALNAKKIPWDDIVIQTLDMTKDGYNPAVAIVLNSKNFGTLLSKPITSGGGRYYITKADAALITSNMSFYNRNDVVDTNGIVSDDTTATYPFESFEEFQYFTGITSAIQGMFSECTKLKSIIFPSSITTYTQSVLSNNSVLQDVILLSSSEVPSNFFTYSTLNGSGIGVLDIRGGVEFKGSLSFHEKKVLIKGDIRKTGSSTNFNGFTIGNNCKIAEFRLKGNVTAWPGWGIFGGMSSGRFFEYMSDVSGISTQYCAHNTGAQIKIHLGYNGIGMTKYDAFRTNNVNMVYVGDGSSKSSDQAVLSQYLSDADWSTQSAKLDLWWNYNGEYRTYLVQNNTTHFTNSNPVEWPYITRNESYNTTIVPTSDTPLNKVRVLMYEAVDDGATPDNPTDITSQVYNPSTGEISIQSVTGNVIIDEI